jgi:hypothetical protein
MIKQDFSEETLKYKVKNNIYPLNSTFGAILQEMIIKEEDEAQEVVSGVFVIENKN